MKSDRFLLQVGVIASVLAALLLVIQIFVGVQIGSGLAALHTLSLSAVADLFVNSAGKLRGLMMLDDAFVIAYLLAFAGLYVALRERKIFVAIGLGAGVLTGFFDFTENSITLGLLDKYFANMILSSIRPLEPGELLVWNVISQLKWLGAGVAAAGFGVAAWDAAKLNRATSVVFLLFAAFDVLGMGNSLGATARVLWMLVMFIVGAVFLSRRRIALQEKV